MPLIFIFGVPRQFQDIIYAVRRLNGSPGDFSDDSGDFSGDSGDFSKLPNITEQIKSH